MLTKTAIDHVFRCSRDLFPGRQRDGKNQETSPDHVDLVDLCLFLERSHTHLSPGSPIGFLKILKATFFGLPTYTFFSPRFFLDNDQQDLQDKIVYSQRRLSIPFFVVPEIYFPVDKETEKIKRHPPIMLIL